MNSTQGRKLFAAGEAKEVVWQIRVPYGIEGMRYEVKAEEKKRPGTGQPCGHPEGCRGGADKDFSGNTLTDRKFRLR